MGELCKGSVVPGTKTMDHVDDCEELDAESAKRHRSVVAR